MTQESFEEQQEALDPHRREERNAAAVEFAARLYGVPDPRGAAVRALDRMRILDRADAPSSTTS